MKQSEQDRYELDRYTEEGYEECWYIMRRTKKVPPSLEVFRYGYDQQDDWQTDPEQYAEALASGFKK